MKMRWGIIGCGNVANVKMAPAIKRAKDCELVAVMDQDVDRAATFAQRHSVKKHYHDLKKFLGDSEIQIVYISTPVYLHSRQTEEAAKYGKDVLCEKPMAISVRECEAMNRICQKEGIKFMIANVMRFNPCHIKAKEIVEANLLGKIVMTRAQGSFYLPPLKDAWRIQDKLAGGGSLMDIGIHCVDLLRFLLGEVREVSAFVDNIIYDYSVEDTALLLLKFTSGAYGIVDSCFNTPYAENGLEVLGSKGSLFTKKSIWGAENNGELQVVIQTPQPHDLAPPWQQNSSFQGWGTMVKNYDLSPRDIYVAQVEYFADCVRNNRPPELSGMEGLKDLRIVEAAYQSSKEHRTVHISENDV